MVSVGICLFFLQVMDELGVSAPQDFLTLLDQLTQAVLLLVENGGLNLLTPSDVLYLSQMIELDLTAVESTAEVDAAEVMVSVATNYMKMASLLLEPQMATQWIGRTEDGVRRFIFLCYEFS